MFSHSISISVFKRYVCDLAWKKNYGIRGASFKGFEYALVYETGFRDGTVKTIRGKIKLHAVKISPHRSNLQHASLLYVVDD